VPDSWARFAYQPNRRQARQRTGSVDLLHGRAAIDGRATAIVCRDFACRMPVTEPEALAVELA
jgi:uncharacterized protein YyaL (SSP411 family)